MSQLDEEVEAEALSMLSMTCLSFLTLCPEY